MQSLRWLWLPFMGLPALAVGDLRSLDEMELADVQGQSGLVIDAAVDVKFDAISYFDDGNGVSMRNVTLSAIEGPGRQSPHHYEVDVTNAGGILTDFEIRGSRLVVGDIVFSDDASRSLGTFIFDFSLEGTLHTEAYNGHGLRFNLDRHLTQGRVVFRDDGNEFILDDISSNVSIRDMILSVAMDPAQPAAGAFLVLSIPDYRSDFRIGAIRFSTNPDNFGRSTDIRTGQPLRSYGSLEGNLHASTDIVIRGGGRVGSSGLTFDVNNTLHSANLSYIDDGQRLNLKDVSGYFNLDSLTLDVAQGANGRLGLLLGFDNLDGRLDIGSIEAPRRQNGTPGMGTFGSASLEFHFADQQVGNRLYQNRFLIQGQGHRNAGYQGISVQAEWSLPSATASYVDDGQAIYLSGISSYGSGTLTLDATRAGVKNGTTFYDGLRIGFEQVKGSYRIDGLRVGSEDAPLQGGSELLLALGLYPAYDFTLDGHLTLAPGGAAGSGITINSDIQIRDGKAGIAALRLDPNDNDAAGRPDLKGLWATEISYDAHLRNMTVDVTDEGLLLVKAESWSTMDIGNLRVGDRDTGRSFGRMVFQRYEKGSSMLISPGGAGNVCVGGAGGNRTACNASGGDWEERGEQGVTIALKQIFAPAVDNERRNRFIWETNRRNGVNGQGTQLIVDNITTNDGDGSGRNEYGFRNDLNVDVYQTKVVKKETGYDANGVYGEKNWEKIRDPSAPHGYRYVAPSNMNESLAANRPLGFAVKARTHFKELSVGQVSLKHPNVSQPVPIVYGMKLQNFDITSNLTATPID